MHTWKSQQKDNLLTLPFTFPQKVMTKPFMLEHIRNLSGEI
ncbi:hypothetical protein B4107_3448 [Bacillus safensis]|nr:hypothetical protein B4107_3448 [Bacillus safensis]